MTLRKTNINSMVYGVAVHGSTKSRTYIMTAKVIFSNLCGLPMFWVIFSHTLIQIVIMDNLTRAKKVSSVLT